MGAYNVKTKQRGIYLGADNINIQKNANINGGNSKLTNIDNVSINRDLVVAGKNIMTEINNIRKDLDTNTKNL